MHRSLKAGGIAVALTLVSVALAYQLPADIDLDLGRSFPSALAVDNFHDAEGGYRWSRGTSRIVFPDVGGYRSGQLELELSGFRPPGSDPPIVIVEVGNEIERLTPSRRVESYALAVTTDGWWSSPLTVLIRSETFTPGAGDDRALGVRVHRARLSLPGGTAPPARQLLLSALIVAIFFLWCRRRPRILPFAVALGLTIGAWFAVSRETAAMIVPIVAAFLVLASILGVVSPALRRFTAEGASEASRAVGDSVRTMVSKKSAVLVALTVVAVVVSYLMTPTFEVDLGSGTGTGVALRFGPLDRDGERTFRRALARASLDLRELGSTSPWSVTIHASSTKPTGPSVLVSAGDHELVTELGPVWSSHRLDLEAPPLGWRPASVLAFPGLGGGAELRIDRVVVDRGRSLPAIRVVCLVATAILLAAGALGSTMLAGGLAALVAVAIARAPIVTIPFLPTLCLGVLAAFVLGALTRGFIRAAAARELLPSLSPQAVSIALAGFLLWFAALASPLYVGGHYGFHTDIAEEIWQGRFLHYYLPYPGSMLSRQPQWDHVIVPHSCLFHTVTAPLAALPRAWFHASAKLFLAALLFGTAVASASIAHRVASESAGVWAALATVFVPTGFQLLGLGHLMTLFGTWASAVALGFIVVNLDRLGVRSVFGWAVALLSLCFLSYTGSLLFASLTLVAAGLLLYRNHVELATRLWILLLAGWTVSFMLYYIHWMLPFLRDSLPTLLGGSGSESSADYVARLLAEPGKLGYTFGSALVPLAALAGLRFTRPGAAEEKLLLCCWASVLVGFSFADVFFNFLLKHHYFSLPVVSVGLGLLLAWLREKGRTGKAISTLFVVFLVWVGLREAVLVAHGVV